MRLYYFTSAEHALSNIRNAELKISTLDNVNDPFELLALTFPEKEQRDIQRTLKEHLQPQVGIICFSSRRGEPVMWSHYAKHHKGVALEFEVDDSDAKEVKYSRTRIQAKLDLSRQLTPQLMSGMMHEMLTTKSSSWRYEKEWRILISDLSKCRKREVDGATLNFQPFTQKLKLSEILIGPKCEIPTGEFKKALELGNISAVIRKTKLSIKSFAVVYDKRIRPVLVENDK